jgi:DNA repair protein RadC
LLTTGSLTQTLKQALALVDCKILDHFVVAGDAAIGRDEKFHQSTEVETMLTTPLGKLPPAEVKPSLLTG